MRARPDKDLGRVTGWQGFKPENVWAGFGAAVLVETGRVIGPLTHLFFRALRIIGPNTIRAMTIRTTTSPMGYGIGTRSVSSWNQFWIRMI